MNILFTSHKFYPDIGGIESVSDMLARALVSAGHTLRLVTNSRGNNCIESQRYHFKIIRKPSIFELISCYLWADIVFQCNIEVRQLWPLLFIRKKLVISLHTWIRSPAGKRYLSHKLKLVALRLASKVISCSNAIRVDSSLNSTVIENPYRDELFRTFPGANRKNSIVFLGRLVSDKGVDLLLKAYATINRPDWPLTIIGSGPERSSLEKLAIVLRIESSVTFLGSLQGELLVKVLNEHEVMVVPSKWFEPFGLVVLEGMASGCVVLASDGGGLPEAVGSAGLLFKHGDETDLSIKLAKLIQDSDLRLKFRSRMSSHLLNFQENVVCKRYVKEIEGVGTA